MGKERVDKARLKAYRSMKDEIGELERCLNEAGGDKRRYGRKQERYVKRKEMLERECDEVEAFVEGIEDSAIRRMFRMYFIEGLSQKEVGISMHLDKSVVSRRIDRFLKVATKTTNATL